MNRRNFLTFSAAGLSAAIAYKPFAGLCGTTNTRFLTAETQQGAIRGIELIDSIRFLGVPFAAPPVGSLRFRAPQPAISRDSLFYASDFAPAAIQNPPREGLYGAGALPLSEDCLALNIWRPKSEGPHPVYVWIHGGGNVAGASRMPVFDGAQFARDGIVCVSLSYRVGCFGFLDVSSILGSDYAGSGNNGILDIVAGLQWVRDNISTFGGDPEAVTIGGQSAGGKNVCTLLGMPAAKGLFRAAIVQSGGAETLNTAAAAETMAEMFTKQVKPKDIASISAEELLSIQNTVAATWPRKYPFRPVIDDVHLSQLPLSKIHAGGGSNVPLLIGTTLDEIAFFGPNSSLDGTVTQEDLANISLSDFMSIYRHYPDIMPNKSDIDLRYAALTAEEYTMPTIHVADAHSRHAPTWRYRLDMPRSEDPNAGYSVHGSELALVWDKLDDPGSAILGPEGLQAKALSAEMHAHWKSFIRTGTPNQETSEKWTRYNKKDRRTMLFDRTNRVEADPGVVERELWDTARFDFSI